VVDAYDKEPDGAEQLEKSLGPAPVHAGDPALGERPLGPGFFDMMSISDDALGGLEMEELEGGEDSNSFPAMPHEPPICSPMNGLGIPQHHLQPYRDTLQPSPGHESPSMHQHQLQGHKLAPGALLGQPKPVQPQIMRAEDFEKMMMAQAQPTEPNPVSQGAPGWQKGSGTMEQVSLQSIMTQQSMAQPEKQQKKPPKLPQPVVSPPPVPQAVHPLASSQLAQQSAAWLDVSPVEEPTSRPEVAAPWAEEKVHKSTPKSLQEIQQEENRRMSQQRAEEARHQQRAREQAAAAPQWAKNKALLKASSAMAAHPVSQGTSLRDIMAQEQQQRSKQKLQPSSMSQQIAASVPKPNALGAANPPPSPADDMGMFWDYEDPTSQSAPASVPPAALARLAPAVDDFPALPTTQPKRGSKPRTVSMLAAITKQPPKQEVPAGLYSSPADFPSLAGNASVGRPALSKAYQPPEPETTTASAFGGPVPSVAFEKWCRNQLRHINGSDDITLVYFLCSLTNQAEVSQYVQQYLGTSPEARKFAEDFIAMYKQLADCEGGTVKGDNQAAKSTPQPAGNSKKGKKKKNKGGKLDASMLGFGVDASGRQLETQ